MALDSSLINSGLKARAKEAKKKISLKKERSKKEISQIDHKSTTNRPLYRPQIKPFSKRVKLFLV